MEYVEQWRDSYIDAAAADDDDDLWCDFLGVRARVACGRKIGRERARFLCANAVDIFKG